MVTKNKLFTFPAMLTLPGSRSITSLKSKYLCNFAVPCPPPFIRVAGGCYDFQNVSVTWSEARVSCQEIGGDLAIVDDCTAMAPIINHIQGLGKDCI